MKEYLPLDWEMDKSSIIKVIGVGGGGNNAVNHMARMGIQGVDFVICNTDAQALATSPITYKIQLGEVLTKGLGAGCNPEQGRQAAIESIDKITELLKGSTEMVFVTAGMGGGTGTGAAPVIAKVAKELGILTVGVVTLPFRDEGPEFMNRARDGIREMQKQVDSLLIIDNQKLYDIYGELSVFDAFPKADNVLNIAVKGIAEIITRPGYINVDLADVKMVMRNSGVAIMGSGNASGENRALQAVQEALSSPLLNDSDISGARNVLVNITSSENNGLKMSELSQIMQYIQSRTGKIANFKRGVVLDSTLNDTVSVTVVATGFGMQSIPEMIADRPEEQDTEIVTLEDTLHQGNIHLDDNSGEQGRLEFEVSENTHIFNITEEKKTPAKTPPASPRKSDKPALVLEKNEDITPLETTPAYMRRNKKIKPEDTLMTNQPGASTKLESNQDGHSLRSDNSFLYQRQD